MSNFKILNRKRIVDRKFLWFDLETVEEVLEDKYTLKQINNLKVGTLLKNLDNFDLGF